MSTSTRSKSASQSSPATGAEAESPYRPEDPKRAPLETVSIELEGSRQRQIAWAIGGTIGGVLLILKLGTVGVWAGYVVIALGLYRAWELAQTFLHPAGTIVVSDKEIVLPRGLYKTRPIVVPPKDVTAAYFLRKSVPWNRSSPVLVIELGEKAMAFPRDWFASEADQRHVVHALLTFLKPPVTEPGSAGSAKSS